MLGVNSITFFNWLLKKKKEVSQYSKRTAKPNGIDFPVLSIVKNLKDQCAQTHRRKLCKCQFVNLQLCWLSLTAKWYPMVSPSARGKPFSARHWLRHFVNLERKTKQKNKDTKTSCRAEFSRAPSIRWSRPLSPLRSEICLQRNTVILYYYWNLILLKQVDMDQLTQQNLPFFYHQFNWEQAYRIFVCILREKGGFFSQLTF